MSKPKIDFTVLLLTASALSISISAAFFSVYGLSKVFAGAAVEVIIMGSILEASKLITAYAIHQNSEKLPVLLRRYLTGAVLILMVITSAGIYGFLSNAYQVTATKNSTVESRIKIVEAKISSQESRLSDFLKEKDNISQDLKSLRTGMSTNTTLQYVDKKTGNVVRSSAEGIRKSLDAQLQDATSRRNKIEQEIDFLTANIDSLKIEIMNMQLNNEAAAELGPLIYLSKISNYPMDKLMNYFILLIVFVFDPLAVCLVLSLSYISKSNMIPDPPIEDKLTALPFTDQLNTEMGVQESEKEIGEKNEDTTETLTEVKDQESDHLEEELQKEPEELLLYSEEEVKKDTSHEEKMPKVKIKTIKKQVPEYKIVDNGQKVFSTKEVEEVVIEPDDEDGNPVSLSPEEYKKLLEKYIAQLQQTKSLSN